MLILVMLLLSQPQQNYSEFYKKLATADQQISPWLMKFQGNEKLWLCRCLLVILLKIWLKEGGTGWPSIRNEGGLCSWDLEPKKKADKECTAKQRWEYLYRYIICFLRIVVESVEN